MEEGREYLVFRSYLPVLMEPFTTDWHCFRLLGSYIGAMVRFWMLYGAVLPQGLSLGWGNW